MKLPLIAALFAIALPPALADETEDNGRVVVVLHNPPGDAPILGPRHAAVTIEFFFNLNHSDASRLHPKLVELARRHPLRLRIVYRPSGVSPYQSNALAIEAARRGLFHEYIAEFFKRGRPRRAGLEKLANDIGLDWKRFQAVWARNGHKQALDANLARASRFRIDSPRASLLINGEPIPRPRNDLDNLETLYDTAYMRARQILDVGYPVSELYGRILSKRMAEERIPRIPVGRVDGHNSRKPKKNAVPLTGRLDYKGPHTDGNSAAPVVIASFCRFASSHCAEQLRAIDRAMAAFSGKVRHVFKPLYDAGETPVERKIHLAAECAADQGAFWEYLRLAYVYAQQLRTDESKIRRAFTQLKLDDAQFDKCLSDERHGDRIDSQLSEAARVGVAHTPSVVIGGRIYIGRPQASNLMRLIELQLAPGMLGTWLENAGR